jgi:hypothetical protein
MTTNLFDRLNKRMATAALSEFASEDCIVESDDMGARLWDSARKGLATGLAAMTILSSVPVAAADNKGIPVMPGSAIADRYVADVKDSIEATGKLHGMRLTENQYPITVTATLEDTNLAPASWSIRIIDPLFTAKTCVATFAAGKNSSSLYHLATKVGADFDIGRFEQMKAASYCALWSSLPKTAQRAYGQSELGMSVVADVVTAMATAKYDTSRFEDVYELQTAMALSALKSGNEYEQAGALVRLGALRTAADYVYTSKGAGNVAGASIDELVEMSHILVKQAQGEIVRNGLDIGGLAAMDTGRLSTALETAGMPSAAKAVEDVRASGLSKEGDYYFDTRRPGCENITHGTVRRERRALSLCKLFEVHEWKVEDGATFVGDFADYANTRLEGTYRVSESAGLTR